MEVSPQATKITDDIIGVFERQNIPSDQRELYRTPLIDAYRTALGKRASQINWDEVHHTLAIRGY